MDNTMNIIYKTGETLTINLDNIQCITFGNNEFPLAELCASKESTSTESKTTNESFKSNEQDEILSKKVTDVFDRIGYQLSIHGINTIGDLTKLTKHQLSFCCSNAPNGAYSKIMSFLKENHLSLAKEGKDIAISPYKGLSSSTCYHLFKVGIYYVSALTSKTASQIKKIENFSQNNYKEITNWLFARGLSLSAE